MSYEAGALKGWQPPVPIWDAHMHIEELPGHPWHSPPEILLSQMDPLGIERAAVMTYTDITRHDAHLLDELAKIGEAHPGRFLLFARLDPRDEAARDLLERAVHELGYVGLKLHTVTIDLHPTDTAIVRLVQKAAELGIPTLFHSGDEELALPDDIGPLAEKVPEATVILAHAGGYFHVDSAAEWAARLENVMIDVSATPNVRALRRALDKVGPERFLYASDGPGCRPYLDLVKTRALLAGGYEDATAAILRDNFRRIVPEKAA